MKDGVEIIPPHKMGFPLIFRLYRVPQSNTLQKCMKMKMMTVKREKETEGVDEELYVSTRPIAK